VCRWRTVSASLPILQGLASDRYSPSTFECMNEPSTHCHIFPLEMRLSMIKFSSM
jgi:hypothetical protein